MPRSLVSSLIRRQCVKGCGKCPAQYKDVFRYIKERYHDRFEDALQQECAIRPRIDGSTLTVTNHPSMNQVFHRVRVPIWRLVMPPYLLQTIFLEADAVACSMY